MPGSSEQSSSAQASSSEATTTHLYVVSYSDGKGSWMRPIVMSLTDEELQDMKADSAYTITKCDSA